MEKSKQQDVISPAEAKFWQEWVQKAPALVRGEAAHLNNAAIPYQVGGIAVGATLGIATFTKAVPGKWKWLSGAAAVGSLAVGGFATAVKSSLTKLPTLYAERIEKGSEVQNELAEYLSRTVTAEMIQKMGIEEAVKTQVINGMTELPTFRLEVLLRRDTGKGLEDIGRNR